MAKNIYGMLTEDLKPPKKARNPPHNWVEQKGEKRVRDKRNQDGSSTPERELRKRKATHNLGSHLNTRDIG